MVKSINYSNYPQLIERLPMKSANKYKISVIIVCHPRYHELLEKALRSLNEQTLKDFQVILVLNGYRQIPFIECDNDITILRTPNTNLSTACNAGINASSGEYIIRLDADDHFHSDILDLESGLLDYSKAWDAVYCNFFREEPGMITMLNHDVLEHACGVMYRRSVFDKLNGYDETLKYQESFDYWIRFNQAGFRAVKIHQPLYYYRKHHGSMSTNTANRNQARIDILAKHVV